VARRPVLATKALTYLDQSRVIASKPILVACHAELDLFRAFREPFDQNILVTLEVRDTVSDGSIDAKVEGAGSCPCLLRLPRHREPKFDGCNPKLRLGLQRGDCRTVSIAIGVRAIVFLLAEADGVQIRGVQSFLEFAADVRKAKHRADRVTLAYDSETFVKDH